MPNTDQNNDPLIMPGQKLTQQQPKPTLELADGTDTGIAQDTTIQTGALNKNKVIFKFKTGNYNNLDDSAKQLNNKTNIIRQTILPLITAAMIELLGSDSSVEYESFNSLASFIKNGIQIKVDIVLKTQEWIGNDITYQAVLH